jgi:hypothetical protein
MGETAGTDKILAEDFPGCGKKSKKSRSSSNGYHCIPGKNGCEIVPALSLITIQAHNIWKS